VKILKVEAHYSDRFIYINADRIIFFEEMDAYCSRIVGTDEAEILCKESPAEIIEKLEALK